MVVDEITEITVNDMSIVEMQGLDIRCHFDKMTVAKTVIYNMIIDEITINDMPANNMQVEKMTVSEMTKY
jgi:hypothetical protein